MAGKWSTAKKAKTEQVAEEATEKKGGMVTEAEKIEKRRGRGKKPQTKSGKGKPTTTDSAQTEPIDVTATTTSRQTAKQAAKPAEPEKKTARPAEPEKKPEQKTAAKQSPAEPEKKPVRQATKPAESKKAATKPAEPEKKAAKSGPKQQPEQTPEVGSLAWMGGVDQCVKLLTQKALDHDKVLEDHEHRIHRLERCKEKDDTFAKKAIPIISELQRDSELSDERLEDLESQFWALWAGHLGITPGTADAVKAPAADDDDGIDTVEDLIGLEPELQAGGKPAGAAGEAEPTPVADAASEAKPKLDPQAIPIPVSEPKPVAKQADGKPRRVYRYWDVETKSYWLTLDIWEAKAADDAYQPLWAWCVDDQIDHVMAPWEVRKYRPGTKADE